ncbi:MAG: SgcJ/EcaC family oxidoreductase [Anaerolineae bacterium]|nr:SgcJ/EcaC family oxidoreductase [Anaerolineae bacterium]
MTTPTSKTHHADSTQQEQIEALYRQLIAAWNVRNAAEFAACFSDDANVIGFDGSQMDGQATIAAELQRIFTNHQTAAYVAKVREVRLLTSETALLRAVVGMVPAGKTTLNPAVNSIQSMVAIKAGDGWRIALFQNTPAQFHGRPDLAEALTAELSQLL